jgi:hypothetical protein
VFIEVMTGPNAGQITPMTKDEFILGKAGAAVAVIRHDPGGYRLIPQSASHLIAMVNGLPTGPAGANLEFGDTIGVGRVVLRFGRRAPL